jgi:hypothetical protein
MSNVSFQFYPANVKITKPIGIINLEQFVEANRNPKKEVQELFKKIQVADEREKQELKQKLFYFTPCITTNGLGRSYSDINFFNGICVVEFDKIPEFAHQLRDWIFNNFDECFCAYISPSGKGTKTLWKIPIVKNVDEFKSYFYGIAEKFSKINGFDGSAQNPILPLYLSWDKDLKYRPYEEAKTWIIRGGKVNEFKVFEGVSEGVSEGATEKELERIYRAIDQTFNKIEREQTAHFYLRNLALWVGGLCGYGYLSTDEASDYICDNISNSTYCLKNEHGYCKTVKEFIIKGSNAPLKLEEDDND